MQGVLARVGAAEGGSHGVGAVHGSGGVEGGFERVGVLWDEFECFFEV